VEPRGNGETSGVLCIAFPPLHAATMLHHPTGSTGDNGSASGIWPVAIVLHRGNGFTGNAAALGGSIGTALGSMKTCNAALLTPFDIVFDVAVLVDVGWQVSLVITPVGCDSRRN
jgi:hypothetical protein